VRGKQSLRGGFIGAAYALRAPRARAPAAPFTSLVTPLLRIDRGKGALIWARSERAEGSSHCALGFIGAAYALSRTAGEGARGSIYSRAVPFAMGLAS
jgi:hypothetical protein